MEFFLIIANVISAGILIWYTIHGMRKKKRIQEAKKASLNSDNQNRK